MFAKLLKRGFAEIHQKPLSVYSKVFLPLEWAYGFLVQLRLSAYEQKILKSYQSPVSVISVGNLTTGGTGKTPIVIHLARGLIKKGLTVVILTRGYGAKSPKAFAQATDPSWGDEAFLIQQQVPQATVIVGSNRRKNLKKAVKKFNPDVILMDDGFQHLRIHANLNLLLINGQIPFGNEHLLPLGALREPVSQLKRADVILITKTSSADLIEHVEALAKQHAESPIPVIPVLFNCLGLQAVTSQEMTPMSAVRNRQVVAVSGVANPQIFELDLERYLTFRPFQHFTYNDHHNYTQEDAADILQCLNSCGPEAILVTTEKDWVKLKHLLEEPLHRRVYTLRTEPILDFDWFYQDYIARLITKPIPVKANV